MLVSWGVMGVLHNSVESAQEHWNRSYSGPVFTDDPEPVMQAALAHFGDVRGKRLLDVGCGLGVASLRFAALGADVIALDQSEVAVGRLRDRCAANGVQNLRPEVCSALDAARLGNFDLVFGSMILHHIEPFAEFAKVLARATRSGGRCFFYENSARNPVLMWFRTHLVGRFGVPKYGDPDEYPLEPREIDLLRTSFSVQIDYPELRLFRLMSTYLFRRRFSRQTRALDRWLYRAGFLNAYSYRQYVKLVREAGI